MPYDVHVSGPVYNDPISLSPASDQPPILLLLDTIPYYHIQDEMCESLEDGLKHVHAAGEGSGITNVEIVVDDAGVVKLTGSCRLLDFTITRTA